MTTTHNNPTNDNLKYLLALNKLPAMRSQKFFSILEHHPDPTLWFDNDGYCRVYEGRADWTAVEKDLAWRENPNCYIVTFWDYQYPSLLKEISSAPLILYVRGKLDWIQKPQIAIVGSRNPTPLGREIAAQFAKQLSELGITITSGLALGIDTESHQASVPQWGGTIAVLGNGVDYIYPTSNRSLSDEIIQNGALVSEFPVGCLPIANHFPRRNRIISGLSLGTLVIEATLKSGSLITAKFALDQGREVFAIPGSIYSSHSRGCHVLIRQGAKLTETIEDILEELNNLIPLLTPNITSCFNIKNLTDRKKTSLSTLSPLYKRVLSKLGFEPTSIDLLTKRCQLTAKEVSIILLELELQGYISACRGGYIKLP